MQFVSGPGTASRWQARRLASESRRRSQSYAEARAQPATRYAGGWRSRTRGLHEICGLRRRSGYEPAPALPHLLILFGADRGDRALHQRRSGPGRRLGTNISGSRFSGIPHTRAWRKTLLLVCALQALNLTIAKSVPRAPNSKLFLERNPETRRRKQRGMEPAMKKQPRREGQS